MNPLCPNCQTELTDDFGLVDCKSCGAVCSVDLDDNVTVQADEPETYEEESVDEDTDTTESSEEEDSPESAYEQETEEEVDAVEDPDELNGDLQTYESDDDSLELESESNDLEEAAVVEINKRDRAVEASFEASPLNGEDFLKDLELFSDEATADGGHIYYDFHVAGIEGGQQKENFIETLADSRLEISEDAVREILGDSSDFTLPQISFLRLTVIYKRLLSLGLDMSWSLSELQEPVSYLSEEIEEVDLYGEEDGGVVYEEAEEEY